MMKRKNIMNGVLMILASFGLFSCSSTNYLTLSVTEPAPVYIPSSIKSIGIIDRSQTSEQNKAVDNLDKVLSIEGKNMDKEGAQKSIAGLKDELERMNRFSSVKIIESNDLKNGGLSIFPLVIPWEKVDQICKQNKVDALFVLSFYDTDSRIDLATNPIEIVGPLGIRVPAIETQATVNTLIKTGWRIYDNINQVMPDQYIFNQSIQTSGRGINPLKAVEAIVGRKQAVLDMSNNMGRDYAVRIMPYSIRVSRTYYVRGTNNFKIGKRRAQTGNWDGAAELWKKEISNPKEKVAGRAYYNMAIISEINGDLNAAIDWASKSYADYGNKDALRYINILKNRASKNKQLERESK